MAFTRRKLPGCSPRQLQVPRRLSTFDQGMDLACAAWVEEDVALPDARLLRQEVGGQQRLADRLGERAVVAREAAGEVGELGVVPAPFAHAVEPLQDAAGGAGGGGGGGVGARGTPPPARAG